MAEECGPELARKIHVIHCGTDSRLFSPKTKPAARRAFSIVCIGSLIEVKGHKYLIEACRLLRERGLKFACHLIGDGPDRRKLQRRIADAGLEDAVVLHGAKTRCEVAEMLNRADVAVQPSVRTKRGSREGIPVSLMEAMIGRTPVVASRISGIPELVEDGRTGILTPPRDVAALADALERLRADAPMRRRMGAAGREKVLREFDLNRNTVRLIGLIRAHHKGNAPANADQAR